MVDEDFYETVWDGWRDMQRYAPAPRYLRRMVMRELRRLRFESLMDVGCGEGTLLAMIAQRYPSTQLAGSEFSRAALALCREQIAQVDLSSLDIVKDDVPVQAYDVIVCVQVLEHVDDDVTALRNLQRMARKHVVISVPGGVLDDRGRRNGHFRHYTKAGLVDKMTAAGFHDIRAFTCGWPIHSLLYRYLVRYLPQGTVERAGLGAYSRTRRTVMTLLDWAYRLNLPFVGTEVFAVGVPADSRRD